MTKKVIGYVRTSTDEQSLSLEAQAARLRAWVVAMDAELVDLVVEQASGKSLERPGLRGVLARLNGGEAESVVVTKLDRLTRSSRDLWWLVDEGVDFVSLTEQVDTLSPAGRMMLTMMSAIAQFERETTAARTSEVLQHIKRGGGLAGGVPYGKKRVCYTLTEEGKPKGGWLEDEPGEQAVLARVRELRDAGETYRGIAETLNAEGWKTRKGTEWKHQYIANLLVNSTDIEHRAG